MNKKHLSLVILSCLLLFGCSSPNAGSTDRPSLAYDADIALSSIDNFRIQMTPRMAQAVATEKGYTLDTRFGSLTFEDLVEQAVMQKKAKGTIYLSRLDHKSGISYEISIDFDFGKVAGIKLDHVFYGAERAKARPLFEEYKAKYPKLLLTRKTDKTEVFGFSPNQNASLILSLLSADYSAVSISVRDINYTINEVYNSHGIR
jgi:hypothetical protein